MAGILSPVAGQALHRAVANRPPMPRAVDASPFVAVPRAAGSLPASPADPFSIETIGMDIPSTKTIEELQDDGFVVVTMSVGKPVSTPAADEDDEMEEADDDEEDDSDDSTLPGLPASAVAKGECRLMGPFAIFVQLGLGALALLSLVFKRWRERPQRPVKVWFFDASKQVFGSVLVHMSNVFLSLLTSGRFSVEAAAAVTRLMRRGGPGGPGGGGPDDYTPNPCSFYLLNLAIDTTVGIPILIVLLRLLTALVARTPLGQPPESIRSGNYGQPPRAWWWLKQSVVYFCGLLGMKVCVLIIFLVCPWISHVGDWALGWTEGNEQVQIVFVMMLFPLIMNGLQYYIIDSYIKKQETPDGDYDCLESDGEDGRPASRARPRSRGQTHSHHHARDHTDSSSDPSTDQLDDEDFVKVKTADATRRPHEYDPAVDGDTNTVLSSGASQRQGSSKASVKESSV